MAEFKVGDRVTGRIFGSKDGPGDYATGTIQLFDSEMDPLIRIDTVDPNNSADVVVGDLVFLSSKFELRVPEPDYNPGSTPARAKVLREAEHLITGERNATYGEPTQNFQDIAKVWTVYLGPKLREGVEISPADTAWMMIGLKMVRAIAGPSRDNWVDAAGYAGCGAECDIAEGVIDG